jgi:hypothetical protein
LKRPTLAVAMVTTAALAFSACGGDSGSTSTTAGAGSTSTTTRASTSKSTPTSSGAGGSGRATQEKAHRIPYPEVAGSVLTSNKPALVCRRLVTRHYLRTAYGDRQGCVRAQAPGSAANSVSSAGGRISGPGTAKMVAIPAGGTYDGERLKVSLVLENGVWKVDALKANVPVGP